MLYGRPYETVRGVVGNVNTVPVVGDVALGAAGIVAGVAGDVLCLFRELLSPFPPVRG